MRKSASGMVGASGLIVSKPMPLIMTRLSVPRIGPAPVKVSV
jgi:hypothetical protein